jgi:hypothetical protein
MWHAEHTLETTARPERIWEAMQAVSDWPRWETGLAWAELAGSFATGASGTMKFAAQGAGTMPGHGPRPFLLSSVNAQRGFTALTRLPLAEVRHIHSQQTCPIGTRLTHRIEIRGPLSWLYGWRLGRRLREELAPGMRRLARLAS